MKESIFQLVSTTNRDFAHNVGEFYIVHQVKRNGHMRLYSYDPSNGEIRPNWETSHVVKKETINQKRVRVCTANSEYEFEFLQNIERETP